MIVVLVEPEHGGNIGSVARAMANFGFYDLWVVRPKPKLDSMDAIMYAKHAREILENAKIFDSFEEVRNKIGTLYATTGIIGDARSLRRKPMTPKEVADVIWSRESVGVVFGRESTGLTPKEIEMCDGVINIPTHHKYPIMNLSHAVAVVLYEIYQHKKDKKQIITDEELKGLFVVFERLVKKTKFKKPERAILAFKRLIASAKISGREATTLAGVLSKCLKGELE